MSILVRADTKVLVQGITGKIGNQQTKLMLDYGTRIVAGATPGRGGERVWEVPVYDSVKEAREHHSIDASLILVPAPFAKDSCFEAMEAQIKLVVLITEHVPVHDAMEIRAMANAEGAVVIGPTTPGIIYPGKMKIGIMPGNMFCPGNVGLISRSGTLTYEIAGNLCEVGIGQSTAVGMGADSVVCTPLSELLSMFEEDKETHLVVVVGEVGGTEEEEAAEYIKTEMKKSVVAYVAGHSVPPGKRMGHAGAIVQRGMGSARSKVRALKEAGVKVAQRPTEVAELVKSVLKPEKG
ncbi:MAG: succinate--CoA ligase subunit alpha [Candidatus Aerophobetes bacterium]